MGAFDVPLVERKPWGILCLIHNCILFGTGTMIAAGRQGDRKQYVFGLLQLFIPVVGWAWSIVWGILIFRRAA